MQINHDKDYGNSTTRRNRSRQLEIADYGKIRLKPHGKCRSWKNGIKVSVVEKTDHGIFRL